MNIVWIATSHADAVAVNSNCIKTRLINGLSTFTINDNPIFINGPRILPRNPTDCTILDNWVFDNFILGDELFAKILRSFETCLSVSNNSCGKLVLSLESPIMFDENLRVTSVAFFDASFN